MMRVPQAAITIGAIFFAQSACAQDPALTPFNTTINGAAITITRAPDPAAQLTGEFARTSRPCPEFCIQPMVAAAGVVPVGELELLAFLQDSVSLGTGLLVDARLPEWFAKGAIPGAVNVPFATLAGDNPYQRDILLALGAQPDGDGLDFSNARQLMIYGNGPWDAQGTVAVRHLVAAGYPADMITNYRGGFQSWLHLGLSATKP